MVPPLASTVSPGGLDEAVAQLSVLATKLNKIPFQKIGDNLNNLPDF